MMLRLLTRRPLLTVTVCLMLTLVLGLWVTLQAANFTSKSPGEMFLAILVLALAWLTAMMVAVSVLVRNGRLQGELRAATNRRAQVEELGLAAAGLAHETKNPLGLIRGLAQQISEDDTNSDEAKQKARQIMDATDVTTARLGDFIRYAKLRDPQFSVVEALPHLTDLCDLIRDDFEANGVDFSLDVVDVRIRADAEMLSQVVLNLLNNCLKSTGSGGTVSVALRLERGNVARLVVADTGTGISSDFLPFVFQPYMTKTRGGYGLGLAVVKRIVERSGWDISIESEEGVGTQIEIARIEVVP